MKIVLVNPRGFCAGVEMAIRCLDLVLCRLGSPVYVFHEIIHNRHVVSDFESRGVIFVDAIKDVPVGSIVVFSAHGVSPAIRDQATRRQLRQIDATCPLVAKVHTEAIRYTDNGYKVVLIGHAGHDEVIGVLGECAGAIRLVESVEDVEDLVLEPGTKLAWLMQTTLSLDEATRILARLRERFPQIVGPPKDDICYATQNRQHALRESLDAADHVIVVGSQNSSNSRRLAELAMTHEVGTSLIDDPDELDATSFGTDETIVVTAGASAPETAVQRVVDWLFENFGAAVEEPKGVAENQFFPLSRQIRNELAMDSASQQFNINTSIDEISTDEISFYGKRG